MKSLFVLLPLSALMAATPYLSMPRAATSGWRSLLDGHSTNGWHSYGMKEVDTLWEVQDGTLHAKASTGEHHDLLTNERVGDFDLILEWKISPGGNSGILFYVQDDPVKYQESYFTGPEMQILDNDGHPDGKITKHHAGDLYDLIACSKETVRPVGEWNQAEIYSRKGQLKLFLNGVNVVSTTLWDEQWRQMVAGSKFHQWPDFGTFHNGNIDLQNHGNEVWFRNIRIKTF